MAIYVHASGMNSQCKCLDFDRDLLANSDTFCPDSLFPASLEDRNRCTHHDRRYDKCLHFDMESVAHREGDLTKCINVIINLGMHNNESILTNITKASCVPRTTNTFICLITKSSYSSCMYTIIISSIDICTVMQLQLIA